MLEQLTIRNFQAHRKLSVDFDPHVTTIVGSSDVGKSAIIRALRWLCLNQPSGAGFIRHGSKSVQVSLSVDDCVITRHKSSTNNLYRLDNQEYKAFKSDVPETISRLLNTSNLNFQLQHDAPFWFSLPASHVSRELNQIVDLGVIDSSLQRIGSTLRIARVEAETSERRLQEAEEHQAELAWVRKADEQLRLVEELEQNRLLTAEKKACLNELIGRVQRAGRLHYDTTQAKTRGFNILRLARKLLKTRKRRQSLGKLVHELKRSRNQFKRPLPDLSVLDQFLSLRARRMALAKIVSNLEQTRARKTDLEHELNQVETNFNSYRGDRCPICRRPY